MRRSLQQPEEEHPELDLSKEEQSEQETRKKKRNTWTWAFPIIVIILVYTQIGIYTIQPIGALPEGVTAIVWRNSGEPFFNSPDALCLDIHIGLISGLLAD